MTEEVKNTQDYLEMSDEEITTLSEPSFDLNKDEEETTEEKPVEESLETESEDEETNEEDSSLGLNEEEEEEESDSNVDYEEIYKKIFQPFKANGREMQAKTPEEVVTLMQMGANYNKKMSEIKQTLPIIKMLEKNNLLNPAELSFLIDLKEKKPEAIAKLVQESGIDLYDFDVDQADKYIPTNRTVSPQEIEIEEVLSSIVDSPNYSRTVQVIGQDWDSVSRDRIVKNPHLIRIINEHMDTGLYDTIVEEVERQKMFGNIKGMSDIEAYEAVGTALYSNNQAPNQENQSTYQSSKPREEEVRRNKVVATSNTRKTNNKSSYSSLDILNMSDEEFEKIGNPNFI